MGRDCPRSHRATATEGSASDRSDDAARIQTARGSRIRARCYRRRQGDAEAVNFCLELVVVSSLYPPSARPAEICAALLAALEAAEGRRRSRKRDQTPDGIGLAIKRDILKR